MTANRARSPRRRRVQRAPLDRRLALNAWVLSQFGVESTAELLSLIDDPDPEGVETEGVTRFAELLRPRLETRQSTELASVLPTYDENVERHWRGVTARHGRRGNKLKPFQYLALLCTEIYLDRYFQNSSRLLSELNAFAVCWNAEREAADGVSDFVETDLNMLAFWMATGAGKTLLMHVHLKQYLNYLEQSGRRRELNRIILLTPNEGLSHQHLSEFEKSGIMATMFSKNTRTIFSGQAVEIIDIHKLAEETGEKTVAVEAFEGNNLVLVDEGHRGSSSGRSGAWLRHRERLCERGFSFEYSATFGQAISPAHALADKYARSILFDYSYRYFYEDGYGKEFRILNLREDMNEEQRAIYLTGCLLTYLQQLLVFHERQDSFAPYKIDRPLWVFVGSRVTASTGTREISDILDILEFLRDFLGNEDAARRRIDHLRTGLGGLTDSRGRDLFKDRLTTLFEARDADQVYMQALKSIFNAPGGGGLHVEQLKAVEGEIELRVGANQPFGVVSVGDPRKVVRQCTERNFETGGGREFGGSLFRAINDADSSVNVLIGAKKFTEGWSSWRVSTMGLMNVGMNEGAQIIQLFGRGVRLKGHDFSLKRSSSGKPVERADGLPHPPQLSIVETLNVFGVRADYMSQFRDFLRAEGVPVGDAVEEVRVDVINRLAEGGEFAKVRLLTLKLRDGVDFRRNGPRPVLDGDVPQLFVQRPLVLDWYPRIQARASSGPAASGDSSKTAGRLGETQLSFLDFETIWFELQRFKAASSWHNLAIPRDSPRALIQKPDWYRLLIPPGELEFTDFSRVRLWQKVATALLKKYIERLYLFRKAEWEANYLEYRELTPDDGNFVEHYTFTLDASETDIRDEVQELQADVAGRHVRNRAPRGQFQALGFDRHLYAPVVCFENTAAVSVRPAGLNAGERDFVKSLETFLSQNPEISEGRDVYLLRNRSRGRGVGFFEADSFYPDFMLWVVTGNRQHLSFVDPKGLRHVGGADDPKLRFADTIKEREHRLGDPNVTLNSFVLSQTPYPSIDWWSKSKEELEARHVLFEQDDGGPAVGRIFELLDLPEAG